MNVSMKPSTPAPRSRTLQGLFSADPVKSLSAVAALAHSLGEVERQAPDFPKTEKAGLLSPAYVFQFKNLRHAMLDLSDRHLQGADSYDGARALARAVTDDHAAVFQNGEQSRFGVTAPRERALHDALEVLAAIGREHALSMRTLLSDPGIQPAFVKLLDDIQAQPWFGQKLEKGSPARQARFDFIADQSRALLAKGGGLVQGVLRKDVVEEASPFGRFREPWTLEKNGRPESYPKLNRALQSSIDETGPTTYGRRAYSMQLNDPFLPLIRGDAAARGREHVLFEDADVIVVRGLRSGLQLLCVPKVEANFVRDLSSEQIAKLSKVMNAAEAALTEELGRPMMLLKNGGSCSVKQMHAHVHVENVAPWRIRDAGGEEAVLQRVSERMRQALAG